MNIIKLQASRLWLESQKAWCCLFDYNNNSVTYITYNSPCKTSFLSEQIDHWAHASQVSLKNSFYVQLELRWFGDQKRRWTEQMPQCSVMECLCCSFFPSYLGCKARCHPLTKRKMGNELVREISWGKVAKGITGKSNKPDRWLRRDVLFLRLWVIPFQYQTHTDNTVIFSLGMLPRGCRTGPIINAINHLRTKQQLMISFCTVTGRPTLLAFSTNANFAFLHQSYRAYRCWQFPRSLNKGNTPGQGVTAHRSMTAALMKV